MIYLYIFMYIYIYLYIFIIGLTSKNDESSRSHAIL